MPFSGGHRRCPGRTLALTMMRIALASIVSKFELLPAAAARTEPKDVAHVRKFVEWPADSDGVPLRLVRAAA